MTALKDDLDLALALSDKVDALSMSRFRAVDLRVMTKPDRTPVTDADQAVEQSIREELAKHRPGDSILGEEYGNSEHVSSRQWIIDPIDGTANFLRGIPIWATLMSLSVNRIPVVGVVSAPALRRRWWAAIGLGAWTTDTCEATTPRRLSVSGVTRLSDASLSFQSIAQWQEAGYRDQLLHLTERVWRDRGYGDMWPYMMLAEGLLDITAEFGVQPYDLAALIPIVEEAGGRFTSVTGEPGPWHGSSLATNGHLHAETLAAISGPSS